ncbi:MAG TPA: cytochrome c [Myxococcaceae bacterium]|nr:cytochrome c [Myxococcaceae bacterium]
MPALLVLLVLALFPLQAAAKDNVLPPNAPTSWRKQCTSCHARNGSGQTSLGRMHRAQDFTSTAWQKSRTDAQIRKVIAEGSTKNRMMRGYGKAMSDAEIDELVAFIRTLDPAKSPAPKASTSAQKSK